MKDRQPENPGRVKLTLDDGTVLNGVLERNDSPQEEGTPLNKATLFDSQAEERYGAETPSGAFAKLTQVLLATVPVSGWSSTTTDGWYTNQVTVAGMKIEYEPWLGLIITSAALAEDERAAFSLIADADTFDGYVIFKALDIPEVDLNVRFIGV